MEKQGVDVPARTGLRVVYLDTDAKTNGTIKLNSSQTPVARSPPLSLPEIHLLSIENAIPTHVYVRVRFATGQSFAAVIKSGIDPFFQIFPWFIYFDRDNT